MWWFPLALAGSPFEGQSADIVAELTIDASPDRVTEALADLPRASGLFGEGCLVRWQVGVPESGEGARARVTYTPHLMRRRLTLEVEEEVPGRRVVWTHEGRRAFDTVWTVEPVPGGSHVRVEVPLEAPGWPLRRLFFLDIQPTWAACYARALRALGRPIPEGGLPPREGVDPSGEGAEAEAEACPPGCVPALPPIPGEE